MSGVPSRAGPSRAARRSDPQRVEIESRSGEPHAEDFEVVADVSHDGHPRARQRRRDRARSPPPTPPEKTTRFRAGLGSIEARSASGTQPEVQALQILEGVHVVDEVRHGGPDDRSPSVDMGAESRRAVAPVEVGECLGSRNAQRVGRPVEASTRAPRRREASRRSARAGRRAWRTDVGVHDQDRPRLELRERRERRGALAGAGSSTMSAPASRARTIPSGSGVTTRHGRRRGRRRARRHRDEVDGARVSRGVQPRLALGSGERNNHRRHGKS